jgi:hypothetical protein
LSATAINEAVSKWTGRGPESSTGFNAAQLEDDTLPERPEPPGLAVRLESAERFVAATGVVVYGGDRACYESPSCTSAPTSSIKMVFQAKVAWFGPSNLSTFLCYKRLLLK